MSNSFAFWCVIWIESVILNDWQPDSMNESVNEFSVNCVPTLFICLLHSLWRGDWKYLIHLGRWFPMYPSLTPQLLLSNIFPTVRGQGGGWRCGQEEGLVTYQSACGILPPRCWSSPWWQQPLNFTVSAVYSYSKFHTEHQRCDVQVSEWGSQSSKTSYSKVVCGLALPVKQTPSKVHVPWERASLLQQLIPGLSLGSIESCDHHPTSQSLDRGMGDANCQALGLFVG